MSADKLTEAREAAESSLGFKTRMWSPPAFSGMPGANVSWQSSRRATFRFCTKPS